MAIQLSIPARVNILGNPTDGNEGAFATISAAINIFAHATIEPHENHRLEFTGTEFPPIQFKSSELPLPYGGQADLLIAAVNRLYASSQEFKIRISERGFYLRAQSDVPRQSGLGGSSLFVLLTLAAMREFYGLDRMVHNDYFLAELAQRIEEGELGITCGFADRYVPLFGGLAYLDYRGKLEHASIGDEPYATYERLDGKVRALTLVALVTGVRHESGDVHGRMRPRYLAEHKAWRHSGGDMPVMVSLMSEAYDCAWRGKIALLEGDLKRFGQLMGENHHLVDEMMRYCGFDDGAGWANNLFIQAEDKLIAAWQEAASLNHLQNAQVIPLSISTHGLTIEKK
jgi:glucuronokinase